MYIGRCRQYTFSSAIRKGSHLLRKIQEYVFLYAFSLFIRLSEYYNTEVDQITEKESKTNHYNILLCKRIGRERATRKGLKKK